MEPAIALSELSLTSVNVRQVWAVGHGNLHV